MRPEVFDAFLDELNKLALNGANPMMSMSSNLMPFQNPLGNAPIAEMRRAAPATRAGMPMTGTMSQAGPLTAAGSQGGIW